MKTQTKVALGVGAAAAVGLAWWLWPKKKAAPALTESDLAHDIVVSSEGQQQFTPEASSAILDGLVAFELQYDDASKQLPEGVRAIRAVRPSTQTPSNEDSIASVAVLLTQNMGADVILTFEDAAKVIGSGPAEIHLFVADHDTAIKLAGTGADKGTGDGVALATVHPSATLVAQLQAMGVRV